MNLKFFKTYQLALKFHKQCQALKMPPYLRDQLLRASSSVALAFFILMLKKCPPDTRLLGYQTLKVLPKNQAK